MVVCCICKIVPGTLKIKDGNPKYKGKPICKELWGNSLHGHWMKIIPKKIKFLF